MRSSDYEKIASLYKLLNEDIGAGVAGGEMEMVTGVDMPDTGIHNQHEHEVTKHKVIASIREAKQILKDLNHVKLNPSISAKLATVAEKIGLVNDWLESNITK